MRNIDMAGGSSEGGECGSPNRRAFIAGLAGLAAVTAVSGCAASKANAVVSGGITIDDEVSCGEKLVGPVSEILGESEYIRYAGELDEACRGVPEKAFDTSDYIGGFGRTLPPDELTEVRVSDEYEAAADSLVAEAKSVAPSKENVAVFRDVIWQVAENYKQKKDKATYDALVGTALKIRKTMDSLEKQMENIKAALCHYLSVSTVYVRMTGKGASGEFEKFKAQKLADLHRKVLGAVNLHRSMLGSHFLLKTLLPDGRLLVEDPPVDLELDLDSEIDDE
jgi:hypothetical protein